MSKKVKIALLPLAAFLLLGFSIAANAGNPGLADKERVITSGPIFGDDHTCSVVWLGNDASGLVVVTIHWYQGFTTSGPDEPLNFGEAYALSLLDKNLAYCTVEWTGQASDVRATWCGSSETTGTSGCVELH